MYVCSNFLRSAIAHVKSSLCANFYTCSTMLVTRPGYYSCNIGFISKTFGKRFVI